MTDISYKEALALADVVVRTPSVSQAYTALKTATRERDNFVADITSRYDENTVVEPIKEGDTSRQAIVINKNGREIVANLSIADSKKLNDIDARNAESTEIASKNYNQALGLVMDKSPAGKKLNEYLKQSDKELEASYKTGGQDAYMAAHPEIILEERSKESYQKSQNPTEQTASLGNLSAPSVAANLDKSAAEGRTA